MPVFKAAREGRLIDVLRDQLPEWRTGTIKQRLRDGLVLVNGAAARSGALAVVANAEIAVLSRAPGGHARFPPQLGEPPLPILYADDDLLAVDKPSGLLSVATEREKRETVIRIMRDWLSELGDGSAAQLHSAHRLDRDASGVLLLARSPEVKKRLAAAWKTFEKCYVTLVDGVPSTPEGRIELPLREDKGLFVRVAEKGGGESALTMYRLVRTVGHRSLLEVRLGTGRKHQIRAHLAAIGCPIVGDARYGVSKARRLALHASSLRLRRPSDEAEVVINARTPKFFQVELAKGSKF